MSNYLRFKVKHMKKMRDGEMNAEELKKSLRDKQLDERTIEKILHDKTDD